MSIVVGAEKSVSQVLDNRRNECVVIEIAFLGHRQHLKGIKTKTLGEQKVFKKPLIVLKQKRVHWPLIIVLIAFIYGFYFINFCKEGG